jgi:rubredoxin
MGPLLWLLLPRMEPSTTWCATSGEDVYRGWCASCEGHVVSGWSPAVTIAEVKASWRCPGCGQLVDDVARADALTSTAAARGSKLTV